VESGGHPKRTVNQEILPFYVKKKGGGAVLPFGDIDNRGKKAATLFPKPEDQRCRRGEKGGRIENIYER